jgi:upstream activation factor subunit UAF30
MIYVKNISFSSSASLDINYLWYTVRHTNLHINKNKNMPKATAPKKAVKKVAKKAAPKKANSAFMKPMIISADLAMVVGKGPMPRSEVVKKSWVYIKKNDLQDAKNKRNINGDANLVKVFGGKKTVSMFEMTKLVSKHLS